MVLAKTAKVPIWGKADPGEGVTVTLDGQVVSASAAGDGKWTVTLNLKNSGPGPFEMTVEGKNKVTLADVVVGEVWVGSGQSNMEMVLKYTDGAVSEIARSANPMLRQFLVKRNATQEPQDDVEGKWVAADSATSGEFSAVGYYFVKKLQNDLKVPVGLIHTSWGGSPSEAWTSVPAINSLPDLKAARERLWNGINEYASKKKTFVEAMDTWIKENAREDKPMADHILYAGENVPTEDWRKVSLPGLVIAEGLPQAGAVWLRKEIDIQSKKGTLLRLSLPIDGYDRVYWNGELLKETTYRDFPSAGFVRIYGPFEVPMTKVKEGRNVLAIRLYQPVGPTRFTAVPRAGQISLEGEWLARTEYEFPALDAAKTAAAPLPPANAPVAAYMPGYLYNGMIHPILPYAIHGVIWYQGESNSSRAYQYRTAFPLLIADWRKQWNQGDFPFYFCQLANFTSKSSEPGESSWAELREAQSMTLKVPNTGQAVLIDIGESGDVHPRNKKDAGERLALIALAKDYGRSTAWSGPVYDSMKINNGKAILTFTHVDGGLVARPLPGTYPVVSEVDETAPLVPNSPQSQIEGFAICGQDKKWAWADAKIEGDKVIVWSDQVPAPVAVRYAWAHNPTCNLYNKAGLPASPFRTDDFQPVTLDVKY